MSNCNSCPSNGECGKEEEKCGIQNNPSNKIKNIIAVMSGKGGVGKSTMSVMLARQLVQRGYSVGILDADITGPSIPKIFGVSGSAYMSDKGVVPVKSAGGIDIISINLVLENPEDPVVWRGPIIAGAVKQFWSETFWDNEDYMFIDMPPGTGDVPLTVFQSIPLDGIVIVTSPQELVSMIVEKAVKMANMMNIPVLGIVENMSYFKCPDCGKEHKIFGESHIDEIAKKYGIKAVAKLPINSALASAADKGKIEEEEAAEIAPVLEAVKNL